MSTRISKNEILPQKMMGRAKRSGTMRIYIGHSQKCSEKIARNKIGSDRESQAKESLYKV